jgi:hypothetical protein
MLRIILPMMMRPTCGASSLRRRSVYVTCNSELLDLRDAVNHLVIMQLLFLFFAQWVAPRERFDAVDFLS